MLPEEFSDEIEAKIIERQSTFVRFITSESIQYKITFIDKCEYLINQMQFRGLKIVEHHELLKHYQQNYLIINISSKSSEP